MHPWQFICITLLKLLTMSTKQTSTRGRAQDRAKVAGGQAYEVNYESSKTGASARKVKAAVKSTGNSRKKLKKRLKQNKTRNSTGRAAKLPASLYTWLTSASISSMACTTAPGFSLWIKCPAPATTRRS